MIGWKTTVAAAVVTFALGFVLGLGLYTQLPCQVITLIELAPPPHAAEMWDARP